MHVKVFALYNGQVIVSEVLSENKAMAKLIHPGWYSTNGKKHALNQVVLPLVDGWGDVSARMKLNKANVLYSGLAIAGLAQLYENFRKDIAEKLTGIKIADASDLNNIKRFQKQRR